MSGAVPRPDLDERMDPRLRTMYGHLNAMAAAAGIKQGGWSMGVIEVLNRTTNYKHTFLILVILMIN